MSIRRVIIVAFPLASLAVSSACTSSGYGTETTHAKEIEGEAADARLWRSNRAGQTEASVDYRIGQGYTDAWMGEGKETKSERVVERYIYYSRGANHVDWSQGTYEAPEPSEPANQVHAQPRRTRRAF